MKAWGLALAAENVEKWLGQYPSLKPENPSPKTIGIVMAGNIPLVGLHDLICVLVSGNFAQVKLSSQDNDLIPALVDLMAEANPLWKNKVLFTDQILKGFDAVIATGSNNTSRYFDYYFGKYPHIIRRNRNGVAVISGDEDKDWFKGLADDIFMYFGLGCRNVSKVYLPEGFKPESLLEHFEEYRFVADHHKYVNNYDYQKSIFLINKLEFYDNGHLLLRPETSISSPISVVHYEFYQGAENLAYHLDEVGGQIQCVVSDKNLFKNVIPAGKTQSPQLWDYADGIDTVEFLLGL
jgi:hypothetical protein